jgi:hypothetical protein
LAVKVWQEWSQLGQVFKLDAKNKRVASLGPVNVIGILPDLTNTALWQVCGWTDGGQISGLSETKRYWKCDIG